MKLLLVTTSPLDDILNYIKEGNEYPLHYFWGYDDFQHYGIDATAFKTNIKPNRVINLIEKITKIGNIQFQLKCIEESNKYDIIFINIDSFLIIIAIARLLKLIKVPIFAISHHSFNEDNLGDKFYNKLKLKLYRILFFKAIDKIVFFSENHLKQCSNKNIIPEQHRNFIEWGADLNFFDNYISTTNKCDYFISVGSSNRDYLTLINSFNNINAKLKIYPHSPINLPIDNLNSNIEIDESLMPGKLSKKEKYSRFLHLREAYFNSIAVLIPIKYKTDIAVGSTVLFEAMAAKKPIIITDNPVIPIDVEREGIGLKVKLGDINAWEDAILYLINNPEEAKLMGERGYELSTKKFKYAIYKQQLVEQILSFYDNLNKCIQ